MTINEIITKHYDELHSDCDPDTRYYGSKTEEDFLQDVCISAMNKYKDDDVDEEEGLQYLRKTLFRLKLFKLQHFCTDNLVFTENMAQFAQMEDD